MDFLIHFCIQFAQMAKFILLALRRWRPRGLKEHEGSQGDNREDHMRERRKVCCEYCVNSFATKDLLSYFVGVFFSSVLLSVTSCEAKFANVTRTSDKVSCDVFFLTIRGQLRTICMAQDQSK